LLLGPFLGAILYSIGGYVLPFFAICNYIWITHIIALFYFSLYPLIAYSLAKIASAEKESELLKVSVASSSIIGPELPMSSYFKIPRFVFGLISQIIVYGAITVL
jgi:hypothetical protein